MRALASLMTLTLLAGCGAPALNATSRAAGGVGALRTLKGDKPAPRKQDAGKLVTKKPVDPVPANVARVFAVLDANGDARVTAAEWPYDAARVERGAAALAQADKDRDGGVTRPEWTAFAQPRFADASFAQVAIPEAFAAADLDASGKLTADETYQLTKALPTRVREALYFDTEPTSHWVKLGDADRDFALDLGEVERLLATLMVRRFGDVG
jgi:hypothetical protein